MKPTEYISVNEFHKKVKHMNKSELIRKIVVTAAELKGAKTPPLITTKYKKKLRSLPKKKLIDTLIALQLQVQEK